MTNPDKLMIKEIEGWLDQYGGKENGKFSRERLLKQLADTMRENEELKFKISALKKECLIINPSDKSYKHSALTDKQFQECLRKIEEVKYPAVASIPGIIREVTRTKP